jgi:N-methylhydantoinase A/oxoprolinase/acetone carboxylase beta subunit
MRDVFRARIDTLRTSRAASSAQYAHRSAAGFDKIIGFDMGGTSTDVSHFAGRS